VYDWERDNSWRKYGDGESDGRLGDWGRWKDWGRLKDRRRLKDSEEAEGLGGG